MTLRDAVLVRAYWHSSEDTTPITDTDNFEACMFLEESGLPYWRTVLENTNYYIEAQRMIDWAISKGVRL